MYSLVTLPLYILPFSWCARRGVFNPSTIFFLYTLLGAWLLGVLLELGWVDATILIAPWAVRDSDIPWLSVALTNFACFIAYRLFYKGGRRTVVKTFAPISGPGIWKCIFALILAIASELAITSALYGGFENWIRISFARTAFEDARINLLFPFVLAINVAGLMTYAMAMEAKRSRLLVIALSCSLLAQAVVLLLSGGRALTLLFVASIGIIFFKRITLVGYLKLAVLALLFLAASGFVISERYKAQNALAQFRVTPSTIVQAAYTGLPFIDHIALSQKYAAVRGHDFGQTYVNALFAFVPRAVWSDKPIQLSRRVREEFFGDLDGGVPPGLFGEAVIAFGTSGLFAMGILLGLLLAKTEAYCSSAPTLVVSRLRLAVVSSLIGFTLVRGGVDIGIYRVGLIIGIYWILEKWMMRNRREIAYGKPTR